MNSTHSLLKAKDAEISAKVEEVSTVLAAHGITSLFPVPNSVGVGWRKPFVNKEGDYYISHDQARALLAPHNLAGLVDDAASMIFSIYQPGAKFGGYTIIEKIEDGRKGAARRYECRCDCGSVLEVAAANLQKNTYGCSKCGARAAGDLGRKAGIERAKTLDRNMVPNRYFASLRSGANQRSLRFEVGRRELWELFQSQDGRCALTGRKLVMFPDDLESTTASVDRKDPMVGYLLDNVQWVHKDINRAKQAFSQDRFIELCRMVAKHAESTAG